MTNSLMWRWAAPDGQQRRVRLDELRAALAGGVIAPNTPVWRPGWKAWKPAEEVPELATSAVSAAQGVISNIPPPPLAVIAVQHEFEAKATPSAPPVAFDPEEEPPPPPRYVPTATATTPASKAAALPAAVPTKVMSAVVPPAPPTERFAPDAPPEGKKTPNAPEVFETAIGLPPPPGLQVLVPASSPAPSKPPPPVSRPTPSKPPPPVSRKPPPVVPQEELSSSMLDEELDSLRMPLAGAPGDAGAPHGEADQDAGGEDLDAPPMAPGLGDVLRDLKSDLQALRAGQPPKNKRLLIVAGVVAGGVALSTLGLLVSALSGGKETAEVKGTAPTASATASASASVVASSAPAASAEPAAAAPTDTRPMLGDCKAASRARVVAPRAQIGAGIEAVAGQTSLALGFASGPREAVGLAFEPASLRSTSSVRARTPGDVRRVVPFFAGGKLAIVPDLEPTGGVAFQRFVPLGTPVDVGVKGAAIVWTPHAKDTWKELFALQGDAPVEALRVLPLSSGKGIALTFRRAGAIFVGVATGESELAADGELTRIEGLGQVGSPAVASTGDSVVVAWADRAGDDAAWGIRWARRGPGGALREPRSLTLPPGGLGEAAMSPSVAALGRGKFLLAWTEGPIASHQVRALTFDADGAPSGEPIVASPPGVNAGQPSATVGLDGHGVIAFLAAKGKANELMVAGIECPPSR